VTTRDTRLFVVQDSRNDIFLHASIGHERGCRSAEVVRGEAEATPRPQPLHGFLRFDIGPSVFDEGNTQAGGSQGLVPLLADVLVDPASLCLVGFC